MDHVRKPLTSRIHVDGRRVEFGKHWSNFIDTPNHQLPDHWHRFVATDDLPVLQKQIEHAVSKQEPFRARYRLLKNVDAEPDAVPHWVTEFGTPFFDSADQFVGLNCCCFFDEGHQVVHESNMSQGERALAFELEKRDRLLAILSHELRNPLAAIMDSIEYAAEFGGIPEELRGVCGIVSRQSNQMARILDLLAGTMRFTTEKVELQKQTFDLVQLVREVVDSLESTSLERKQTYEFDHPDQPMWVNGEVTQLMQAFTNLIRNAIKYTPEHGRVKTTVSCSDPDQKVVVAVSDSGQGINPENQQKIFELFYQEHADHDQAKEGLGIGLFLVNQIIREHGGSVSVHSEGDGKGCEFVARLALVDQPSKTVV